MIDTLTDEEREKNKAFARAKALRLAKVENWLKTQDVVFRDRYQVEDPWRLRNLAEQLIEAIDKGKL